MAGEDAETPIFILNTPSSFSGLSANQDITLTWSHKKQSQESQDENMMNAPQCGSNTMPSLMSKRVR